MRVEWCIRVPWQGGRRNGGYFEPCRTENLVFDAPMMFVSNMSSSYFAQPPAVSVRLSLETTQTYIKGVMMQKWARENICSRWGCYTWTWRTLLVCLSTSCFKCYHSTRSATLVRNRLLFYRIRHASRGLARGGVVRLCYQSSTKEEHILLEEWCFRLVRRASVDAYALQ